MLASTVNECRHDLFAAELDTRAALAALLGLGRLARLGVLDGRRLPCDFDPHGHGPAEETGILGMLITFSHRLNAGVAMFFVISGYCITAAADSARRQQYSVGQYFARRFCASFRRYGL